MYDELTQVDIDKMSYEVGGGGINSAIAFARHGHEAIFMGNIAHDPAGAAIVRTLDREGVIRFYGFQENPKPFYVSAHCVVLPSWHEGMSNVLLEGASTGRALITSDIPGCREAVADGKSGFLAEVKNSESLYRAMKRFLSLSCEERARMGRIGRMKMERQFDRSYVVEKTLEALKV